MGEKVTGGVGRDGGPAPTPGVDRRARATVRIQLCEALRDRGRHELVNPAAERGDLLDPARRDEAVQRARHHVHGLDLRREHAVQVVHLELPLEVGDHAEPLHHRLRVVLPREVDDELGEDVDDDVLHPRERALEERDALLDGNSVCLCCGSRMTPTTTRSKMRPRAG